MKLDVVSNYKIDRLVKMTKVTKFVSKCFKKDVVGEPKIILGKWINEGFSIDMDTYYECFNKIYKDLISVKMRMFQYKLSNFIFLIIKKMLWNFLIILI